MQGFATFNTESVTGYTATVVAAAAKGLGVRVFDVHLVAVSSASSLQIKTNSATGPTYIKVQATDGSMTESFVEGILFPNGCYLSTGAGFAVATITYTTEIV